MGKLVMKKIIVQLSLCEQTNICVIVQLHVSPEKKRI